MAKDWACVDSAKAKAEWTWLAKITRVHMAKLRAHPGTDRRCRHAWVTWVWRLWTWLCS